MPPTSYLPLGGPIKPRRYSMFYRAHTSPISIPRRASSPHMAPCCGSWTRPRRVCYPDLGTENRSKGVHYGGQYLAALARIRRAPFYLARIASVACPGATLPHG